MNNKLTRDINRFVASRVEARDYVNKEDLEKEKATINDLLEDIATELIAAGNTKYGNTVSHISGTIYDAITSICCTYQEDGYSKGLADGYEFGKHMTSLLLRA